MNGPNESRPIAVQEQPTRLGRIANFFRGRRVTVWFGFLLPLLCLGIDTSLRASGDDWIDSAFEYITPNARDWVAQGCMVSSMVVLALWLWRSAAPAVSAGLLMASTALALYMTCFFVPLGAMGFVYGEPIGVLGLVPPFTTAVYGIAAWDAFGAIRDQESARLDHGEIAEERQTPASETEVHDSKPKVAFGDRRRNVIAFGVVLPILCFVCDPIVFRGSPASWLGRYGPMVYIMAGLSISHLLIWRRTRLWPSISAGLFCVSSLFALGLGVALLPMSVIGILVLVGVFGFLPFFTTLIYWAAARRARSFAGTEFRRGRAIAVPAAIAMFFITAQVRLDSIHLLAVGEIAHGSETVCEKAIGKLRRLGPFFYADDLVFAYVYEKSEEGRERLEAAYLELTGELYFPMSRAYTGG